MPESTELLQYAVYLRRRWMIPAVSCLVAVTLATTVTFLQPEQFTAQARVLIHPPTSDSFPGTAISPTYMESLRTYEHIASGDSLFKKAVEHLKIRRSRGSQPLVAFKQSVLTAEVPSNTRILRITATLPDPRQAQALAEYIAQEVARMGSVEAAEGASPETLARGERLQLIDPGVVPESASSPRLLFRIIAAVFAALILSFSYLTVAFAVTSRKSESRRQSLQVASKG